MSDDLFYLLLVALAAHFSFSVAYGFIVGIVDMFMPYFNPIETIIDAPLLWVFPAGIAVVFILYLIHLITELCSFIADIIYNIRNR